MDFTLYMIKDPSCPLPPPLYRYKSKYGLMKTGMNSGFEIMSPCRAVKHLTNHQPMMSRNSLADTCLYICVADEVGNLQDGRILFLAHKGFLCQRKTPDSFSNFELVSITGVNKSEWVVNVLSPVWQCLSLIATGMWPRELITIIIIIIITD